MKLKAMFMTLLLIMLMPNLGGASESNVDFGGDGWLNVYFEGHDVACRIDSTTGTDLGIIRDDSLWVEGEYVLGWQWVNPFTVDRAATVTHGSAAFVSSYQGLGAYGASVEASRGIGEFWSHRVSSDTNIAFSVGALADSDYTISMYASNVNPFTSVEVAQSNLAEDGQGSSEMLVSWGSNSLSSGLVEEWNNNSLSSDLVGQVDVEWNGRCILHLISNYRFLLDILSLWQTPAIAIETVRYLSGWDTSLTWIDLVHEQMR